MKKKLAFWVFIEPGHGFKSGQFMNLVKIKAPRWVYSTTSFETDSIIIWLQKLMEYWKKLSRH